MRNIKNYIPNIILSILLALLLLSGEALIYVKNSLVDSAACTRIVENENIAEKVIEQIETYFDGEYDTSGIPSEVYTAPLKKALVKESIIDAIVLAYSYVGRTSSTFTAVTYDFTDVEKSITDYFHTYADENNLEKDAAFDSQLAYTIKTAKNEMLSFMDVMQLKLLNSAGILPKLRSLTAYIKPLSAGVLAAFALVFILIIIMNNKKKVYILYWLGCSLCISSLLVLIPSLIIKLSGYVEGFMIKSSHIYAAVTGMLNTALNNFITFEAVTLLIGASMFALFVIRKRNEKKISRH